MKPTAGDRLNDRIELLRPLGAGGMGSVWVARHLALECDVAVKFVAREVGGRQLARFKREASLAAKLKSPHVVRTFDFGACDDGTPYIVMELLGGESLAERLARDKRSPPEDAAQIVSQVALALGEAHALGIVHRDVKPANIFLVDSGYAMFVKLLDFGVAKQTGDGVASVTHTGAVVGTPHYMSPEQLMSTKDVDGRADLWSLAVVAYHMLTGEVPFAGKTMAALSLSISQGRFTPASALNPALDPELDAWFKLALCRNINGRFQTAAELSQSFAEACDCEVRSLRSSRPSLPARSEGGRESDNGGVRGRVRESENEGDNGGVRVSEGGGASERERESEAGGDSGAETVSAARDPIAAPRRAPAAGRRREAGRWWPLWLVAVLGGIVVARNWGFWRARETSPDTPSAAPSAPADTPAGHATGEASAARATAEVAATAAPLPSAPPATTSSAAAASASGRSPRVRPAPRPSAEPAVPDCTTPFVIDDRGVYHPRPECLR